MPITKWSADQRAIREWAVTGYSVQEIQARLPAYVEGVEQARHYNI